MRIWASMIFQNQNEQGDQIETLRANKCVKVGVIIGAHTIIDPRTVMVHVKYASITSRAMMTTFRLEHITHKAISASFVFIVTQVETPEYRYLSRISRHCLEERPEQHKE